MKKLEKTLIYVVNFSDKKVIMREVLSHKNTKKEQETLSKIDNQISILTQEMSIKQSSKKAS